MPVPLSTQHLVSFSPTLCLPLLECQTKESCSSAPVQRLEAFLWNYPGLCSSSRGSRECCLGKSEIKPETGEHSAPIPGRDVREELNN